MTSASLGHTIGCDCNVFWETTRSVLGFIGQRSFLLGRQSMLYDFFNLTCWIMGMYLLQQSHSQLFKWLEVGWVVGVCKPYVFLLSPLLLSSFLFSLCFLFDYVCSFPSQVRSILSLSALRRVTETLPTQFSNFGVAWRRRPFLLITSVHCGSPFWVMHLTDLAAASSLLFVCLFLFQFINSDIFIGNFVLYFLKWKVFFLH